MPRGPRLDAPGVLHHVMVRGIERRPIFRDDRDRRDFVARLAALTDAKAWEVYAWALLPKPICWCGRAAGPWPGPWDSSWRKGMPETMRLVWPTRRRGRKKGRARRGHEDGQGVKRGPLCRIV